MRHIVIYQRFFLPKSLFNSKTLLTFALANKKEGVIAQLVEQRTENPCVPGSIPGDTTKESYLKE